MDNNLTTFFISIKARYLVFSFVLLLILGVSGCQSPKNIQETEGLMEWNYADMRLLDPVDTINPDQELIAVYTRIYKKSFQIRLDFLDLADRFGKDIYIPIDTNSGGADQIRTANTNTIGADIAWDYLIKITSSGIIQIINPFNVVQERPELFLIYDSLQDRLVIDVINNDLPIYFGQTKIQVIIAEPESAAVADKCDPFLVDDLSPARAQVVLAFWNTFSSVTPAQALRSWAGAHSGPASSRHGLKYLLDSASRTNLPIYLVDFSTQENYSALAYLGVINKVVDLDDRRIINIIKSNRFDNINRNSFFVDNNNWNFGDNDYAKLSKFYDICNLLPGNIFINKNDGMSLACKRLLIIIATERSPTHLVLGGDFTNSSFGIPAASNEIFSYFATHPWIQILTSDQLITEGYSTSDNLVDPEVSQSKLTINYDPQHISSSTITDPVQQVIFDGLLLSPDNKITQLAWRVYNSLIQPSSAQLLEVRKKYIGQLGGLIAAAKWVSGPSKIQDCSHDIDYDNVIECVFANNGLYAIIDPEGGYISLVFSIDEQGIHQIIGPTWEFYVGLSDPSSWNPSLGIRSDSAQILGAFQDSFIRWQKYDPQFSGESLVLTSEDGAKTKSVSISGNKIHIEIHSLDQSTRMFQIPLVIDPWIRFSPDWGDDYYGVSTPYSYQWGIKYSETVSIYSSNNISAYAFNDTKSMMSKPEDPNFDYSRGHYLPFPMALVEIQATDKLSIDITINQ